MFGDRMGLMAKLQESKAKAEETKKRLETVLIDEQSSGGLLKATVTASGRIKEIHLDNTLLTDKEQLEDYLILTLNKALEKAQSIHDTEMAAVAKEGMPDIPGMDMFT
jgi:DNA-binding protein YbaB